MCETMRKMKKSAAGFTLIEVLLVVVIIGLLAAVALPRLGGRKREAEISSAKGSISGIGVAIDLYETDNGQLPENLNNLITKGSENNWNGPYIRDGKVPVDPWGTQFQYSKKDNTYELRSAGPDKSFGTTDDVTR